MCVIFSICNYTCPILLSIVQPDDRWKSLYYGYWNMDQVQMKLLKQRGFRLRNDNRLCPMHNKTGQFQYVIYVFFD